MNRCSKSYLSAFFGFLALLGSLLSVGAHAQVRNFPHNVIRGNIAFVSPPQVLVNGQSESLAPGVRVRNEQNLIALTGTLTGRTFTTNYLRDPSGLIREVWILSPDELGLRPDGSPMPIPESVFLGG